MPVLEGEPATITWVVDNDASIVEQAQADVRPGETTIVNFGGSRRPRGSLVVRARSGGEPVGGLLLMAGSEAATYGGVVDASGVWRALDLPAGPVTVAVQFGGASDDFGLRSTQPLEIEVGRETAIEWDLPRGVLHVQVLEEGSDRPVVGASVVAMPVERGAEPDRIPGFRARWGASGVTDAAGLVVLAPLLPGAVHTLVLLDAGGKRALVVRKDVIAATRGAGTPAIVLRLPAR